MTDSKYTSSVPAGFDGLVSGRSPAQLANDVSDAIAAALKRGMETDEAVCVAVAVLADYARIEYGNGYLSKLARVVKAQADRPMPRGDGGEGKYVSGQ